jgi:DNA-binding CsgD family transcriptional regulator
MSGDGSTIGLLGRRTECAALSGLLATAKAGRSEVLVLRGEAGIGKTALLDFLLERAVGCQVGGAAGVESEMELAFSGLHQLCRPYLDRLNKLPAQQRDALSTAFGLQPGNAPDRFLLGLSVLTLLYEVAEERPLICMVDDAQWLDQASTRTLEFVAHRLAAEPIAMVFATRDTEGQSVFRGFPDLTVRGLSGRDAADLLQVGLARALDPRVRDRILAESQGNPLALLELPRGLSAAELAFGGDTGAVTPLDYRLEQVFRGQVQALPRESRQFLLAAAAEPVGDAPLLWRAAERLGLGPDAAVVAEAAGLIELREGVRFRHPLVRSTVYHSASRAERREAHRALADVTDPDVDPDRRAWHFACAATGPDEAVAAELERSAGRARSHGGFAAAAAFLGQAATLTPDQGRRAQRSIDAAEAKVAAGAFGDASALLSAAVMGPIGEADRGRIELLRAQMSFAANRGNEALPLHLVAAARRLEPLDAELAHDTCLDALSAALIAGRLATGAGARHVAEAVRSSPAMRSPRKTDLLLEGLAVLLTEGYTRAAPLSHRAVQAFVSEELTLDEALRFAWLAASTAVSLWDDSGWNMLTRTHLEIARESGALSALPLALTSRIILQLFTGDLAAAEFLVNEIESVSEVTGGEIAIAPYGRVCLSAVRGDAEQAELLIQDCLRECTARGEGVGVNMMQWARAFLCNGMGRYKDALPAAQDAAADPLELGPQKWALAEIVEAGVRSGNTRAASAAHEELSAMARASGTEWAQGTEAAMHALLCQGDNAEQLYQESIARLASTTMHVGLGRARLLYGEWLRREGRRVDARAQLRPAHEALTAMGVDAFAERARHELLATGETVRKRTVETAKDLTAQEAHIARLAVRGLTNPEIGAELYISPRTVEWHLRKIFAKVGVSTRRELRRSMSDAARTAL